MAKLYKAQLYSSVTIQYGDTGKVALTPFLSVVAILLTSDAEKSLLLKTRITSLTESSLSAGHKQR